MTMRVHPSRRVLLAIALLLLAVPVALVSLHVFRRANPDVAYQQITGHTLPPGIRATAYNWAVNDNLFHVAHYWILTGSEADLRRFATAAELGESTEDARWTLPNLDDLFGDHRPRSAVAVGFEGDQARNNWLWIFDGRTEGLYEYN